LQGDKTNAVAETGSLQSEPPGRESKMIALSKETKEKQPISRRCDKFTLQGSRVVDR
jgi:hypothetical protein